MPPNPDTLVDLGHALLANLVADVAATMGATAVPSRQVFAHGLPVRECDQLAVWLQRIEPSFGGRTLPSPVQSENLPRHVTHVVTWGIDLALCSPVAQAPIMTGDGISTEGDAGARYAWTIWRSLTARWVAGTLFAPVDESFRAQDVTLAGIPEPVKQGGFLVVTTSLSANTKDTAP